jgi:hypothetical protein
MWTQLQYETFIFTGFLTEFKGFVILWSIIWLIYLISWKEKKYIWLQMGLRFNVWLYQPKFISSGAPLWNKWKRDSEWAALQPVISYLNGLNKCFNLNPTINPANHQAINEKSIYCHTWPILKFSLNSCKSQHARWATKWYDYHSINPTTHTHNRIPWKSFKVWWPYWTLQKFQLKTMEDDFHMFFIWEIHSKSRISLHPQNFMYDERQL